MHRAIPTSARVTGFTGIRTKYDTLRIAVLSLSRKQCPTRNPDAKARFLEVHGSERRGRLRSRLPLLSFAYSDWTYAATSLTCCAFNGDG